LNVRKILYFSGQDTAQFTLMSLSAILHTLSLILIIKHGSFTLYTEDNMVSYLELPEVDDLIFVTKLTTQQHSFSFLCQTQ